MFSGLIVLDGSVERLEGDAQSGMTLVLDAPGAVADGVALGDSIAVNGACLTVVAFEAVMLAAYLALAWMAARERPP